VQAEARVAVLGHLEGLNHVFVHAAADPKKAVDIV
jgi:glutamate-5-semialdehyde dehydrogenase